MEENKDIVKSQENQTEESIVKKEKFSVGRMIIQLIQGALIGVGGILPGVSGGVLCVMFGIYKPIMELIANPFKRLKTHAPKLFFYIIGCAAGFLGIARLLAFVLEKYPAPSVCLFIGLIAGMLPSLWKEAGKNGRKATSYVSLVVAAAFIFGLLIVLRLISFQVTPNFGWFIFCGVFLALSVFVPGLSFSTMLMPLGLYTPLVEGVGNLSFEVLIPAGIGGLLAIILLSKAIIRFFEKYYSVAYHAIVGIVFAATVMIIPFSDFMVSTKNFAIDAAFLVLGIVSGVLLDKFNSKVEVEK